MTNPQNQIPAMTDEIPPRPQPAEKPAPEAKKKEIGGPAGPEPTRYGDWEQKGRCTDF
jgi:hypothetical protein